MLAGFGPADRNNTRRRHRRRATFSSNTQLVIETVTVSDKSGKTIEGLTAKDFTVTEDGAPQAIQFFEYQKLPEIPDPLPPRPDDITVLKRFPHTRSRRKPPGNTRYRDHRLLALYFDMTAMPPADQLRALDGRAEVHQDANDLGRPDGDHDVSRAARSTCCRISPPIATGFRPSSKPWSSAKSRA